MAESITVNTGGVNLQVTIANGLFIATENGTPIVTESNNYIVGEKSITVDVTPGNGS
jgi:hypothetical protein